MPCNLAVARANTVGSIDGEQRAAPEQAARFTCSFSSRLVGRRPELLFGDTYNLVKVHERFSFADEKAGDIDTRDGPSSLG